MKLEQIQAGRGQRAIVVVPGFATESADFEPWAEGLRLGRFGGDIWVVRWPSGSLVEMAGRSGAVGAAGATLMGLAGASGALLPFALLAPAAAVGWRYWRTKLELARDLSKKVRKEIRRLRLHCGYREIVLVAHSLGVEMTWAMLETARTVPFDQIVLLGGASSATDGCWATLEHHAPIYNVANGRDLVLGFFYRVAERGDLPLGLAVAGGDLVHVDVCELRLPRLGHDYIPIFPQLESPHRWRPSRFG